MNILKLPDPISLTGNAITLKVQENDIWQQTARRSLFALLFQISSIIEADDYITLRWAAGELTIYFRDNPNASQGEYITGAVNEAWVNGLFNYLETIYLIERDFEINVSAASGTISFQSKEPGSQYTITASSNMQVNKVVLFPIFEGLDAIMYPGLQIICMAKHPGGAIIGQEAITPEPTGVARFDMSAYLHTFIHNLRANFTGFHYPSQTTKIFKHATHVLPFQLLVGVKHHQNFVTLQPAGGTLHTIMGGKQHSRLTNFYQDFDQVKQFLTSRVWKRISRNSPERLYFYSRHAETITVKATITRLDAEDETVTIGHQLAEANTVYEIDATLSYMLVPGNTIEHYVLWVENSGGTKRSLEFYYIIDERHYDNEHHFIFRNSYGGYDTVRTTGRTTRSPEVLRDEFTDENYKVRALLNLETTNYTANTGSISESEKMWMDDLMLSKEVYWITGNRPAPIIITSSRITPETDNQRRFNLQFDFKLAHSEQFHSTDFTTGTVNQQPGIDV